MKRYDEALADLNRAIELDPSDAEVIGIRGQTYQAMKRYDEGLADLNRAVELDPNYRPRRTRIRVWVSEAEGLTDRSLTPHHTVVHVRPSGGWDATGHSSAPR